MKKLTVAALTLALVVGSLAAPVSAGKKKKKKPPAPVSTPVTLFFSNTSGGCTDDAYVMVLAEPTEGSNCGTALSGPGNEVLVQSGDVPDTIVYNAAEGVPFVLDATQKLTGTIQVMSYSGAAENPGGLGAGPTTLVVEVTGGSGGEAKQLGSATVDYIVNPATKTYPVDFEIALPGDLDKAQFDSLAVSVYNRGAAPLHGFYRAVQPASKVIVPTWK